MGLIAPSRVRIPLSPPYISHNPFRNKGLWYPTQILTYNSTHKMPDRMLRIAQVMELTGLSRSTIYAIRLLHGLNGRKPAEGGGKRQIERENWVAGPGKAQ